MNQENNEPWELIAEYVGENIDVGGATYKSSFGVYASSDGQLGWDKNTNEPAINLQGVMVNSVTEQDIGAMLCAIAVGPKIAKEFSVPQTMTKDNSGLVKRVSKAIEEYKMISQVVNNIN